MQAKLSPDGQFVAFLREYEGKQTLFLTDLKERKLSRVIPATERNTFQTKEVSGFRWVGNRRLAFGTLIWDHFITGVSAVDCDGRNWKTFAGPEARIPNEDRLFAHTIIHVFDDPAQNVLMLDQHRSEGALSLYPDVVKVSTLTGHYVRVAKNPGRVVAWGADDAGTVRVGVIREGQKPSAIYRDSDEAPWRPLPPLDEARGDVRPLGFEPGSHRLYLAALSPQRRWAVYPFDPATGAVGDVFLDDPEYDLVMELRTPTFDGIPLASGFISYRRHALVGVRYVTENPRVHWFDPEFAAIQRAIDRALPDTYNVIAGASRDDQRFLLLAYSDRNPGTYFLFNRADNSLTLVATRMGWIKPAQMAAMHPVKYPARDGLLIHGYVTFPPEAPRQNLPLVVLPHGGPWVRDVWGFDPLVQMLASRGYAVLQMNFRGSAGYGEDFYERGRRQVGGAIQDDIEDGTRWAIAQGLADPRRIAIVGADFGGYAALYAMGHSPELYRCGVSIAGVTDWPALFEERTNPEDRITREFWIEQIGDPGADESRLRAISPVNFADKIAAPVLMIQGREDHIVPPKQARAMVAALQKAGRSPESLFLANEGHFMRSQSARTEAYQRIAAFLGRYLGP